MFFFLGCFQFFQNFVHTKVFNSCLVNPEAQQSRLKVLLNEYDVSARPTISSTWSPTAKGPPVSVYTSIVLHSISSVNEVNMEFGTFFTFKQRWFDGRLGFLQYSNCASDEIQLAEDQTVWKPDTFFQNEKSGYVHLIKKPNFLIRIRNNGEVLYDVRIAMIFSCLMDLLKYPFDVQKCSMEFASYAYTTEDIVYEWDQDPFSIDSKASSALANMVIDSIVNGSCKSKTNTGEYSCLKITMTFVRSFSYFIIQLYIPSSLLVAVSWISYWIDWKASAGRMLLAIVTLLTLIQQSYYVSANLPPVSYAKAADVWFGGCIFFVFISLIEYAVINFLGLRHQLRMWKPYTTAGNYLGHMYPRQSKISDTAMTFSNGPRENSTVAIRAECKTTVPTRKRRITNAIWQLRSDHLLDSCTIETEGETSQPSTSFGLSQFENNNQTAVNRNTPEIIDKLFRIIVPCAFALFAFTYWSIYK